jgi:YD repeat-containing protein
VLYTLDAAGNKIREETFGTDGTVKRVLARQYDTLSRLKAQVRAAQAYQADPTVKTEFLYDANSNLDRITDPLGRITEHDHDALNRLIKQVQDLGGIAAEVEYEYDARDQLRKVIDPKNLTTEYVYDGLGNQITLISPGHRHHQLHLRFRRKPREPDRCTRCRDELHLRCAQSAADDRIPARKGEQRQLRVR